MSTPYCVETDVYKLGWVGQNNCPFTDVRGYNAGLQSRCDVPQASARDRRCRNRAGTGRSGPAELLRVLILTLALIHVVPLQLSQIQQVAIGIFEGHK